MKKINNDTAVIYTHVSGESTLAALKNLSRQAKLCEAYCKEHKLRVIGHFDEIGPLEIPILADTQLGMAIQKCLERDSALVVASMDKIVHNFDRFCTFTESLKVTRLTVINAEAFTESVQQHKVTKKRIVRSMRISAGSQRKRLNSKSGSK